MMAFCPEHPKWDQNPKFTPLSETTSIPTTFICGVSPSGSFVPRQCGWVRYSVDAYVNIPKVMHGAGARASHTNIPLAGHAVYSPQVSFMRRRKAYCTGKEGYASTQANWKRKSEFYKKEELSENSTYSFEQIRSTEKNSIGVSQSKILIDATISSSFQALGIWGNKELRREGQYKGIPRWQTEEKTEESESGI